MVDKWNERYRGQIVAEATPAPLLRDNLSLLTPPGLALELACGLGANGIALCRAGFQVEAWDLSPVAIEKLADFAAREGLALEARVRDVVAEPPSPDRYDVIVVQRFLERPLCPAIAAALRPGGVLFYQTFCGAGPGPSNPAFRLEEGELPRLFAGLQILVYREESATGEAQLIARRPAQESRGRSDR